MNWLCRMIGHKWMTTRRHKLDGAEVDEREVWGCCVRCGEPSPVEMDGEWYPANVEETKENDNGKV